MTRLAKSSKSLESSKITAEQNNFNLASFLTKEVLVVAGLLFLAFILRLIYLSQIEGEDPIRSGTDMRTYHNYAIQIINEGFPKEPYYYSPLYSYFVGTVYFIFGADPSNVRTVQSLLGILTLLFIYLITRKVFDKKAALYSLILAVLYGIFLCYEGTLLVETLSCFLITLAIFLLLEPLWRNIILGGIVLGLAALTRANILFIMPFILCWMILDIKEPKKRIIAKFAILSLAVFLTILPCTIRNYLVSKRFVFISTNGPVNIWMGNNRYANGQYYVANLPFQKAHEKKVQEAAKEKGDKAYLDDVWDFAKERPFSFIKLQVNKFLLFWGSDEISNNVSYDWVKRVSSVLRLPFIIGFSVIAPLGLIGAFYSLRKRRFRALLLVLFILAYSIATTIVLVLSRYRLPVEPVLLVFAGFSISFLYEYLKKREWKKLILPLTLLLLVIFVMNVKRGIALVYPNIFPNGVYTETQDGLLIEDISDIFRMGKGSCILDSSKADLRKELIIDRDPKTFNSAILFINARLIPNKKAMMILKVNGQGFYLDISDFMSLNPKEEFMATMITCPLDIGCLKEGKNLFELGVAEGGWLSVLIDSSFCYKRSSFRDSEEKAREEIDGEYLFSLWLQKAKN